jgi:hypothetical protein
MRYIFTNEPSNEKHEVLEMLYTKYAKLMYYIAYEILKDQFLAEDAVQNAFLKLEKSKFKIFLILTLPFIFLSIFILLIIIMILIFGIATTGFLNDLKPFLK